MLMDDLLLRFQGFQPTEEVRSYLNERMSELQEEAPYGARLDATFSRHGQSMKGVVTIHSFAGKFFAVASGANLVDVTQRLIERLRRRLDRWKSRRFRRPGLRDVPLRDGGGGGGRVA